MISRKGLNDLIADYRRAHNKIDAAASVLEDASIMIGATGFELTRTSVQLIDQTTRTLRRDQPRDQPTSGRDSR